MSTTEPETIAVPAGTLRLMLARARAGLNPNVPWSESAARMTQSALSQRKDALGEIQAELEEILGLERSREVADAGLQPMVDTYPMPTTGTREWWGHHYPVLAKINDHWDLVAHPNGPGLCNGDTLSVIDQHREDGPEMSDLKAKAQRAFRELVWPIFWRGREEQSGHA